MSDKIFSIEYGCLCGNNFKEALEDITVWKDDKNEPIAYKQIPLMCLKCGRQMRITKIKGQPVRLFGE